ncbi:hypothetical protein NXY56_004629 [Leishmania guyanensis]
METLLHRSCVPAITATPTAELSFREKSRHFSPHESGAIRIASPSLRTSDLSSLCLSIVPQRERTGSVGVRLSASIIHYSPARMLPESPSRVNTLARDAVKSCEQQLKQEEEPFDSSYREVEERRASKALAPSGACVAHATEDGARTRGAELVGDSDDEDVYNSRIARRIRAFLESIREEDFTLNPPPVDATDMEANGEYVDEETLRQQRLERMTVDEMRSITSEAQRELLISLYDAITLETDLMEISEDVSVLKRAVGQRDEVIEMLKVQLSTADEYNEELHNAKKEALRKLSDAKTEMALLSQRNAKLSKLLQEREEELQLSLLGGTNTLAGALLPAPERRDEGTITTEAPRSVVTADSASVGVFNKGSCSTFSSPTQHRLHELEEMLWKLQCLRDVLHSKEKAKDDLDQQVWQLAMSAKGSRAAAASSASPNGGDGFCQLQGVSDASTEVGCMPRCRCKEAAGCADSLEEEAQILRVKVLAQGADTRGAKTRGVSRREIATKTEIASQEQLVGSSGLVSTGTTAPPGQGGSCGCGAPAGANLALLQRQLDRAQADARRLESELRAEREKSKRQSVTEKKLLENVTSLAQQLRAREALDRETRRQRRAQQSGTRGDDGSAAEGRRTLFYPSRFSLGDRAGVRREVSAVAEDVHDGAVSTWAPCSVNRVSGDVGVGAAAVTSRTSHASSPELRRRRESIFASLRDAHTT